MMVLNITERDKQDNQKPETVKYNDIESQKRYKRSREHDKNTLNIFFRKKNLCLNKSNTFHIDK